MRHIVNTFNIPKEYIKYSEAVLPHEFEHTFLKGDAVYQMYKPTKAKSETLIQQISPDSKLLKEMQKEMGDLIGIDPSKIPNEEEAQYLTLPTELLARGTQIKNWLGITDPYYKLTAKDIKEAAVYYTSTGFDNNMTAFFNSITDWDKAAEFLSKATIATGAVAGTAIMASLNEPTLISKKEGKL